MLTTLSASAIVGQQVSGPYGNTRYQVGTMGTTKGYTGQFHDAVSGLDYYHARYYDPVVGQFVSVDEKQGNAQGADPSSYVAGNPETATDPTGLRISCPPDCGILSGVPGNIPCAFGGTGCGGDCGDRCGGGGPLPTPHPAPTPTPKPAATPTPGNGGGCVGSSCCQGTVWNGSACVPKPDHSKENEAARDKALLGGVLVGVGLIVVGAIIVTSATIYSIKNAIEDVDLPSVIQGLIDLLGIASEVASALSLVNSSAATVAFGLTAILHGVLAFADGALSAYKAMMAGFSWMKGIVKSVLKLIGITIGGAPGVLFKAAGKLFGQAIAYGARAIGNASMAGGNAMLADIAQQKSMSIDDWCAQYGRGSCITTP